MDISRILKYREAACRFCVRAKYFACFDNEFSCKEIMDTFFSLPVIFRWIYLRDALVVNDKTT